MKTNPVVIGIIVILVGAGSFYGGMKYQQTKTPTFNGQFGNGQFQGMRQYGDGQRPTGTSGMVRPIAGKIISADKDSITVEMEDGSSKIVVISSQTNINKAEKVSADELKEGVTVSVFGSTNSDGSVTAQNIQLNPNLQFRDQTPSGQPSQNK